jgi:hypothetical protein
LKSTLTSKVNADNTLGKSPSHYEKSIVSKYLTNVAVMNKSTAVKYNERLKKFEAFVSERYGLRIDEIIKLITKGKIDAYDALGNYILYLREKSNNSISPITLKNYEALISPLRRMGEVSNVR